VYGKTAFVEFTEYRLVDAGSVPGRITELTSAAAIISLWAQHEWMKEGQKQYAVLTPGDLQFFNLVLAQG
jgi:hypothetical protein